MAIETVPRRPPAESAKLATDHFRLPHAACPGASGCSSRGAGLVSVKCSSASADQCGGFCCGAIAGFGDDGELLGDDVRAIHYRLGRTIDIRLDEPCRIEIDGDGFGTANSVRVWIEPEGLTIRVPQGPAVEEPHSASLHRR